MFQHLLYCDGLGNVMNPKKDKTTFGKLRAKKSIIHIRTSFEVLVAMFYASQGALGDQIAFGKLWRIDLKKYVKQILKSPLKDHYIKSFGISIFYSSAEFT
ncbi:hypothetical protein Syun_007014 [Stephania yunnanensis]|uniref:Uncharacterized protein n=1 Tax=Stephania yunnanensis TaxID=152371 RepID=A0AAP0PY79_9MAGN